MDESSLIPSRGALTLFVFLRVIRSFDIVPPKTLVTAQAEDVGYGVHSGSVEYSMSDFFHGINDMEPTATHALPSFPS